MPEPTARPPRAAMLLGLSGLLPPLPFLLAQVVAHRGGDPEPSAFIAAMPALGYAALILSFLGGMWWSAAAMRVTGRALWGWLGVAVLPSLWAWASFPLGTLSGRPATTGVLLASGLLLSLLADRAAVRAGLAPPWWMRLRVPLSLGLAAETLAVGLLA